MIVHFFASGGGITDADPCPSDARRVTRDVFGTMVNGTFDMLVRRRCAITNAIHRKMKRGKKLVGSTAILKAGFSMRKENLTANASQKELAELNFSVGGE